MRTTLVAAGLAALAATTNAAIGASQPPQLAALPLAVPAPADNPSTPERVELGRLLFWDPILSGGKDVACATCHHPDFGYSDGLALSIGANGVGLGPGRTFAAGHVSQPVKRNSQTVLNVAFNGLAARTTERWRRQTPGSTRPTPFARRRCAISVRPLPTCTAACLRRCRR